MKATGVKDPQSVTPDEWGKLPFLRRSDIQRAGKELHSETIPRGHGKVGDVHTSGTTGEPIRVLRTELCGLFWSAFTLRDHLWHGRDFSGKLAVIRNSAQGKDPYPDGTTSPRWGTTDLIYKTGPGVSLNINCTVAEQVDWLEREAPKYLLTHPTNVYRLAGYCVEKGIGLNGLEQVQTISEILRPEVRDACKAAWGWGWRTCIRAAMSATWRCNARTMTTTMSRPKAFTWRLWTTMETLAARETSAGSWSRPCTTSPCR